MDLAMRPEDVAFRDEVRAFLNENLTEDLKAHARLTPGILADHDLRLEWLKRLHKRGWSAPSWPKQYGGPGWNVMQRFIYASECAAAGARFGTLAQALFRPAPGAPPTDDDPVELGRLQARARQPWVQAAFAHLTQHEIALLGELHAHLWAPDVDFATRLLRTVAKACEHAAEVHGTERETLARVLRREAARMLTVFHHAGLIDQAWMDARFEEKDIARFLSPIRPELPLPPSPKRCL